MITILVSAVAFLASTTLDAFCISSRCTDSLTALLLGWFLLVVGGANFAWLTNLTLFGSWITIRFNPLVALILSGVGLVLGSLPLMTRKLAVDEAGTLRNIQSFEAGYWLWMASSGIVCAGALIIVFRRRGK